MNQGDWISMKDQEPAIKDLPFLTLDGRHLELWSDSDWFDELSEKERLAHEFWLPVKLPK